MEKIRKTMDGNEAAAYVSYAFTEVAAIYPITPSSPMAEKVDEWSANGKKNLFGQTVSLVEMQSEAGAMGAVHGALEAGTLSSSYTASQGLMLMVPTMFRVAGQLKPCVLHVSARTVGTHALSIFGDHSDVMACRQTGFAMLSTGSVQEIMDLAGVAHLSAIKGRVPFIHFFDGFRTSHELQKIEVMDYSEFDRLLDKDAVAAFRQSALNPEHPVQRSTVQGGDIYFQAREASNSFYDAVPEIVENYMKEITKITGREYKLFQYYGAEDAENIIIAMGSVSGAIKEVVDHYNAQGKKYGYLQVHLYRPFSIEHFLQEIPDTVKKITVLDRTKEPGSLGEPLYLDVCAAFTEHTIRPEILAGRYGLSSKDVTPAQMAAVFENMALPQSKNHFTVGIEDDVTFLSLPLGEELDVTAKEIVSCKFWGLGSDGTVGANKNSIKIIGDHTDMYVQAYFEYDTKKSGGVTKSNLRFGSTPIIGSYAISKGDFIACHNPSYVGRYDMVQDVKDGGTFLLNCGWSGKELEEKLPAKDKKYMAEHNIKLYTIDATKIAGEIGLGNRTNTVLQAAFFKLANIIPIEDAVGYMKEAIQKSYGKKGEEVVAKNCAAVDRGVEGIVQVDVPKAWADSVDAPKAENVTSYPEYIEKIVMPVNMLRGDSIPVSAFKGYEDGTAPMGTTKYEKRGIAVKVPKWNPEKCIQCNQCSYVCPHSAIRPFLLDATETANAPFETVACKGKGAEQYTFRLQVDALDCAGCGSCEMVCPAKEKALTLVPLEQELGEMKNWEYCLDLTAKENPFDKYSVKGSQFEEPLLEFSGACAGCGETPYAKLLTQLFGDRMYLAAGTGCAQAWGAVAPTVPFTTNKKGCGPAWSNSLFENNAEFSLGMCLSVKQQRERMLGKVKALQSITKDAAVLEAIQAWEDTFDDGEQTKATSDKLAEVMAQFAPATEEEKALQAYILENKDQLAKKSMWMFGGDGWAYDIGYGGLDHILSRNEDVNILVVDTEVYSNTGGQASKATQIGAVAQFAAAGKPTAKKDLGLLAMTYKHAYVAQVAMGANPTQLVKAIKEAEQHKGTSLIIAYAPCINHGIVKGMAYAQPESKAAVASGYWNLYRYNPALAKEGKNPFQLDSPEPKMPLADFLQGETRFAALSRTFPERAEVLLKEAAVAAKAKYAEYQKMAKE